ncbi:hypothetical protein C5167_016715 [Papaver somniferum]|uniref:indole-3-acetic acid-amido synthetase GH3.6-like isoform X1 n=1 Tax=Papaver somniferum TaxID=3469 RepID=UPI000E6F5443|nr:indole-3-acetic acid-amido synthetase GH3.6-like isoform X1 [Papaver somniferum]RZC94023.1 hypothetical protein C5167_016715 [Papaver somniferum]
MSSSKTPVSTSSIADIRISTSNDDYYDDERYEKALQYIEEVTTHADEIQKRVLSQILSINQNVEYLQRHCLSGHTDLETFKKLIPVITYEDLKPDIDRILANGNTDSPPILCQHPISKFFRSSGTSSGVWKSIPTTEDDAERRSFFRSLIMPIIRQKVPDLDKGKVMYLIFVNPQVNTPGGITLNAASTSFFKSSYFLKEFNEDPYYNYTSPIETMFCEDSYQSMYSQLLCGLYYSNEVLRLGAPNGSGLVQAIRFLQENWTILCNDIRTGSITNVKITDPSVLEAVLKVLKPNPKLAEFIETECKRDESWKGIIARLWPNAKYIKTTVTGSTMSHFIPTIDSYSNGLPIVSIRYTSSECYLGLNLNPLCKPNEVSYTLIPTMGYFEFIPVDDHEKQQHPELVDLANVKLGQEYEIVVTTYAGLYRYRVGDVLRVAGFKNNAPQFNFMRRKDALLSIETDKTNEVELQNAVQKAAKHLVEFNLSLVDYTSYSDRSTIPGHYVLFWELQWPNNNDIVRATSSVFEQCCLTAEESLGTEYRHLRNQSHKSSIGPLEIRIVEKGTFKKLMDYATTIGGAAVHQYKTPRSVKLAPILELLNSRVVSNYISPKCPSSELQRINQHDHP